MSWLDALRAKAQSFLGIEKRPEQTSAVHHDAFDSAHWESVKGQVPGLKTLNVDLQRQHHYVDEFMEDMYHLAYKAIPEMFDKAEMAPTHVPNHSMLSTLNDLPEFQRLRSSTRGSEYGAAMAMLAMEKDIRRVQEETREAQERAKEAQEQQQQADNARSQVESMLAGASMMPDPNGIPSKTQQEMEAAVQAAEQAAQQAQEARQQAQDAADSATYGLDGILRDAARKAAEEREEEDGMMRAFGVEEGELERMDFEERRQLAQSLRTNRLAEFWKVLGQFRAVQKAAYRQTMTHAVTELAGVTLGDDLTRMVPAELMNLATPELEDDFWMRWANRELVIHQLKGKEKLGQGGVIVVCDESGSMATTDCFGASREAWSKALSLALAEQARVQGREFHYIGFSAAGSQWQIHFPKGRGDIKDVITLTEHFFNGGTHYEKPLEMALDVIEKQYAQDGCARPDIVFVTDDEYQREFSEAFMSRWNRVKDKHSLKCYGIALGCSYSGALEILADNVRSLGGLIDADPTKVADLFKVI